MEKLKKRLVRLLPTICMVCLLPGIVSCTESKSKKELRFAYEAFKKLKKQINKSCIFSDSLKTEINEMPFDTFIKKNPLKREISKINAELRKELDAGKQIWDSLISFKEKELNPVRNQYRNKTEILRIKRIWLNGDLLPWTYESWLSVSYIINGSYHGHNSGSRFLSGSHSGSISGTITPNMSGHAKYAGENKLDYINVVFSDNTYKRFLIKDNPEWLLAREGEKVERRYQIKNYKVGEDVGGVLASDAFDLLVNITYVPLFK